MAAVQRSGKALLRHRQPPFVNAVHAIIRPKSTSWALPLRNFLLVLLIGLLLGRVGPVGTFTDLSPVARYLYWGLLTPLMWVQTALALHWLRQGAWGRRLGWPLAPALAALAGAVPTLFEVAWAEGVARVGGALTPWSLLKTYGDVCLFALALTLPLDRIGGLALRPTPQPESPPPGDDVADDPDGPTIVAPVPSHFLDRIPAWLGRDLLALSAEDHYLRLHTALGSDLILCRLGEAEDALAAVPGLRVHRSWWVALAGVRGTRKVGEKQFLIMANGLEVPVSRSYLLAARAAGLPV